jgi:hypothetical protein
MEESNLPCKYMLSTYVVAQAVKPAEPRFISPFSFPGRSWTIWNPTAVQKSRDESRLSRLDSLRHEI